MNRWKWCWHRRLNECPLLFCIYFGIIVHLISISISISIGHFWVIWWKKKQSKFNASSVRYRCSTVAHSQLKKKHASIFTFQFFWHLFISKSMRALNLQWFRWFRVHELPSVKLLCTAFAEHKFDKILFCIIWLSALAINRFWFCLFGLCIRSVVWFEYYEFCRERFIVWMAIELEIIMISCTLDEHRITAKMIFRI